MKFLNRFKKKENNNIDSTTIYIVHWSVRDKNIFNNQNLDYNKPFTNKEKAEEFKIKLKEAANFLGCWIYIDIKEYNN